jgi:Fe-S-cluster containining protein
MCLQLERLSAEVSTIQECRKTQLQVKSISATDRPTLDLRYHFLVSHTVLPKVDGKLVQIVDKALAESARKSGEWLVCRKGCTQCCIGVFPINQLDVARLRQGMAKMDATEATRASAIRERARRSLERIGHDFPGDTRTGVLDEDEDAQESFMEYANDEPCPALSPTTGECELYAYRPMTCRVFGPPVRSESEEGLGVCELCYHGATDEEIAACELRPDPDDLESSLVEQVERRSGVRGNTIIAFCLAE